jgi:rRNA-processing protein FCF1
MPPAPRALLDGTERLIIDGTNLLHRMGSGSGNAAPPAAIVGRIRAVIPIAVAIDIVFDGAGHGVSGRVAQNMHVRYSGRRVADDTILDLASEAVMEAGSSPTAGLKVLIVTDDRELRARVAAKGARTASLAWLLGRLDIPVLAATSVANRRPPAGAERPPAGSGSGAPGRDDEEPRTSWKPGRGATAKSGPARKVARHKRHPRAGG